MANLEIGDKFDYNCMWRSVVVEVYTLPILMLLQGYSLTDIDMEAALFKGDHYNFATSKCDGGPANLNITDFRNYLCRKPVAGLGMLAYSMKRFHDEYKIWEGL